MNYKEKAVNSMRRGWVRVRRREKVNMTYKERDRR